MRFAALVSAFFDGLQRLVHLVLSLAIVAALALFALTFVHGGAVNGSWLVLQLRHVAEPLLARLTVAFHLQHLRLYAPLVLAALIYVALLALDWLFTLAHGVVGALSGPRRAGPAPAPGATGVASEEAREKLYREYRKIEQTLKEAKRKRCTFLSVDVVGSTGMKSGETEIAITSTFRAYEQLLRRTFRATHAWKESWTPDGVMICFLNREDAVQAGKAILTELLRFNERENALKTRFDVRCGANEGEVVVFEDSDLEKLVEHVIDVAGHMQKHATPGTLRLSKELYEQLADPSGFSPTGERVDGYETYAWSPAPASV